MGSSSLPIERVLPDLLHAVEDNRIVVLQAPPGAGKTTGVPLALLGLPSLSGNSIILLEPRRLAAVNSARWMASTLGEDVGETVGYRIRFDTRITSRTRIEVVTEGILVRRLQSDPLLEGVGIVLFDEFHERNLDSDLSLALCRDVLNSARSDLRLVVMSATLDGEALAEHLGAPLVRCEGKAWPVDTRYLTQEPDRDPARTAASVLPSVLAETSGDLLVFLPGVAEIRRCMDLVTSTVTAADLDILPLYGDLPYDQQEKAILPSRRRKIVISTNIAETSLTIEGVAVVVDAGFERRARFDPSVGLTRMSTARISAASADQRKGRAGRTGPGTCYRLWTRHAQSLLAPHTPPEILVADLAPLVLQLASWGVPDASLLPWLDEPPSAALDEGRRLLRSLGLLDERGLLSESGRKAALLPLHPRLAVVVAEAVSAGSGDVGIDLAALLSERDIFRGEIPCWKGDNDLSDRLEVLWKWRRRVAIPGYADPSACRIVDRVVSVLRKSVSVGFPCLREQADAALVSLLLARAYPDRIGRRRSSRGERYLLSSGRGVRIAQGCVVRDHEYIVAPVIMGEESGEGLVRQAAALSLEMIRETFAGLIVHLRVSDWNEATGRVEVRDEERLGEILLSSRSVPVRDEEAIPILLDALRKSADLSLLGWTRESEQFRLRVEYLRRLLPEEFFPDFSFTALSSDLLDNLYPYLSGVRSRLDLSRVDPLPFMRSLLSSRQNGILQEEAPTHLKVPSGSRILVDYSGEGEPFLAVKLQELFGLADSPKIARGRGHVILHLLSPAGRPVQVTKDLRSFWERGYQLVRSELRGRYPKHPWPEDPFGAVPTRYVKKRQP